jgi:hypothetical protein
MRYSFKRSPGKSSGKRPGLRLALIAAILALPAICYAQDAAQSTTRQVEKFSLSFEPDEVVELELTTANNEAIRPGEFLTLQFFNRRNFITSADFNLEQLPLITIAAVSTGYGKAELTINGVAGGLVPVRRNRIYLLVRALVNTIGRDYKTDELILIPSDKNLRGLMTLVDKDGGRSTRTVVTTSMKIRVSE